MPYQTLQYQHKAEPLPLGAVEVTTPDKWHAELPDSPVRRGSSLARFARGSAFVPLFASAAVTPVYVNSQASEPVLIEEVQYQSKAEPLVVTAPESETVTSDKWDREQSQPRRNVRWSAEFVSFVTDRSSLLSLERNSLDKWLVRLEQPRRDLKRQQYLYPSFHGERLNSIPTAATPLYVSGSSAEPIGFTSFQYQRIAKPVLTPAATPETITADKWSSSWPQPYMRGRRIVQYGVNCAIAEQLDDGLPPVYWIAETNKPPRSTAKAPLFDSVMPSLVSFAESVNPDKWRQETQRPRWELRNHVRLASFFTADARLHVNPSVENISLDKWNRAYPDIISRKLSGPLYIRTILDPSPRAERESIDKWGQLTQQPRQAVKRTEWLYPPLALDSQFYLIPPTEIIKLDKWARQGPDVLFVAQRLRDYGQFTTDPTLQAERITLDKWRAVYPERMMTPTRLAVYAQTRTGVEDVAESSLGLAWYQPQPVPRRTLLTLQYAFPDLAIDGAFHLVPSGGTDHLSPAKHIANGILYTSHVGIGILFVSHSEAGELQVSHVDASTLFTEDVGTEP